MDNNQPNQDQNQGGTPTPQGNENPMPQEIAPQDNSQKGGVGPIIGAVIVVLVLVLGGLYLWGERWNKLQESEEDAMTEEESEGDAQTSALLEQGTSDEISDIEDDLDATELENLDAELDEVVNELEQ